jgi:hypothetical protein
MNESSEGKTGSSSMPTRMMVFVVAEPGKLDEFCGATQGRHARFHSVKGVSADLRVGGAVDEYQACVLGARVRNRRMRRELCLVMARPPLVERRLRVDKALEL